MPPLPRRRIAAVFALLVAVTAAADDRTEAVAKQKAAAEANIKKAGLPKLAHVETDDLIVYAAVPAGKAKGLADAAQKAYTLARIGLKETGDKPWPGKLAVIVLTEQSQFTNFVRLVEQRRPEKGETTALNVRGDTPYAVDAVDAGEKATDAEVANDAATVVAGAVLAKKAGTGATLPDWLTTGFGRMIAARADTPARQTAYRNKAKAAILGTKSKPIGIQAADVWGGEKLKDGDVIAASLVEYLVYGPEAEKFPKLLSALKPSDEKPMPTFATALYDLEWKPEALDLGWKQWLSKAK